MLENTIIGIIGAVLGALVIYTFRVRQLYVVIPRHFSTSLLSSKGQLVEIRIYNKSRASEEEVIVALDPLLNYEIVASTDASPSLDNSAVLIPRIPPRDDFSVMLLVENGILNSDRVSRISSKSSKGRVVQKIEDVPPNFGNVLVYIVAFVLLFTMPIAATEYYGDWKKARVLDSLNYLTDAGWNELDSYALSDLIENYSKGEFPIHQSPMTRKGDSLTIPFLIINKSATELDVNVYPETSRRKDDPRPWENTISANETIAPKGEKTLSIKLYWPKEIKGTVKVLFHLQLKNGEFISIKKNVEINE